MEPNIILAYGLIGFYYDSVSRNCS